ncbi:MAG: sigma factor-like helix-turn-helix DNA-binding protein [Aeromonas veronii]
MAKLTEQDIQKVIKAVQERYPQATIAKAFGVSQARISQILKERGISKPKKQTLDITKF